MSNKQPLWLYQGLNCFDTHVLEVFFNQGDLQIGTAIGPDGQRYAHTWVVRNGQIVDLFHWTGHDLLMSRDMPENSYFQSLLDYLDSHMIEWELV